MLFTNHLKDLHHLAAESIEQVYQADVKAYYADLVYHHHAAGNAFYEQQYAHLAGEQAFERFAPTEALEYFNRALTLTDDVETRYELLLRIEEVHHLQAQREPQDQILSDLESLLPKFESRIDIQGEINYRRARYLEVVGELAPSAEKVQKIIESTSTNLELLARSYLQFGIALMRQGKYKDATENCNLA